MGKNSGTKMLKFNKEQLTTVHRERLNELVAWAGNYNHLAKMLDIQVSTVQGWLRRGRISVNGTKMVKQHPALCHEFTTKYLRPDM